MIKTFISLVIVVLLFFSTIAYTFTQVLKPEFLSNQAREVNLYGRLSGNLPALLEKMEFPAAPLETAELAEAIAVAIDGNRFYNFLDSYLNAHIGWLTDRTERLKFSHSIVDIKESLGDSLTQKLLAKYDALPVCQSGQLRDWSFETMQCRLSEESSDDRDIARLATRAAGKFVSTFPDEITVTEASPNLVSAQSTISRLLRLSQIIWLITALVLAFFVLIYRRNAFGSLSVIFLLVGLFQVLFSRIAWDWVARLATDVLGAGRSAGVFAPLIADLAAAVAEVLKTILGNLSIIALGVGAIFLVLAVILRPKPRIVLS